MPDIDTIYTAKVYNNLKNKFSGFTLTQDEFNNKLATDPVYKTKVYSKLKDNFEGFTLDENTFYSKVGSAITPVVAGVTPQAPTVTPTTTPITEKIKALGIPEDKVFTMFNMPDADLAKLISTPEAPVTPAEALELKSQYLTEKQKKPIFKAEIAPLGFGESGLGLTTEFKNMTAPNYTTVQEVVKDVKGTKEASPTEMQDALKVLDRPDYDVSPENTQLSLAEKNYLTKVLTGEKTAGENPIDDYFDKNFGADWEKIKESYAGMQIESVAQSIQQIKKAVNNPDPDFAKNTTNILKNGISVVFSMIPAAQVFMAVQEGIVQADAAYEAAINNDPSILEDNKGTFREIVDYGMTLPTQQFKNWGLLKETPEGEIEETTGSNLSGFMDVAWQLFLLHGIGKVIKTAGTDKTFTRDDLVKLSKTFKPLNDINDKIVKKEPITKEEVKAVVEEVKDIKENPENIQKAIEINPDITNAEKQAFNDKVELDKQVKELTPEKVEVKPEEIKKQAPPVVEQEVWDINKTVSEKNPDVSVWVTPKDGGIYLNSIHTPELKRDGGLASKALTDLKAEADRLGKKIITIATDELGGDLTRLKNLYEKNGFKEVGENKYEYTPESLKSKALPVEPTGKEIVPAPEVKTDANGKEIIPAPEVKTDVKTVIDEVVSDKGKTYGDIDSADGNVLYGMKDTPLEAISDVGKDIADLDRDISKWNEEYKKDRNYLTKDILDKLRSEKEQQVEFDKQQYLESKGYIEYNNESGNYELTDKGKSFVDAIDSRVETRKGVKEGTDLFPEDANIPELVTIKKELNTQTDGNTINKFEQRTADEVSQSEPVVKTLESKGENAESLSDKELQENIDKIDQVTGSIPIAPTAKILIDGMQQAVSDIKENISNVKLVSLKGNEKYETILFEYNGKTYKAELKGDNKNLVVGFSKDADISVALKTLLSGDAKAETKTEPIVKEKSIESVTDKYGWKAEKKENGDYELSNKNGKKVATVKQKGDKYTITNSEGIKILSGNKDVVGGVEKAMKEYWYAKEEVKAETKPITNETVSKVEPDKKEVAKQTIQKGLDGLAEKMGIKKSITPEERTTLIEDIKNIIKGITDLSIEEIKVMVKDFLNKFKTEKDLTDKDIADITNESVKDIEIKPEPVITTVIPPTIKPAIDVAKSFERQRNTIKSKKKTIWEKIKQGTVKHFTDVYGVAKKQLREAGFLEAVRRKSLEAGASAMAKQKVNEFYTKIFKGLKPKEKELLDDIIQARRDISVDTRFDAQGKPRPKHLGGNTKESYEAYLKDLEKNNPELYKKLNTKADAYFDSYKELLDLKLKEGRISQEVYDKLINNEYSPRVALSHLMDAEMTTGLKDSSVGKFDIKNIKEGTEGEYFNDSRWLLETSTLQTYRTIFKNRTDKALYDFAEKTPDNGLIEIQKQKGFNKETGQPIYSEAPAGKTQIQFFDNGVKKSMLMENEIAKDWINDSALHKYTVPNIVRVLTGGSTLRAMATGINPVFALSNIPKDFLHALFATEVYSTFLPKAIGQIGKDIFKVTKDVFTRKGRYQEYLNEGGGMDLLTHQGKILETGIVGRNKFQRGADVAQNILGYINESSELLVRIAIREGQIKKLTEQFVKANGRQPNAKELTTIKEMSTSESREQMDFSRGGDWTKFVDNFIPYTNAGFQGFNSFVRAAKRNPKVFAAKVGQIGMVSAAMYLYNSQFDEWDDISADIKARNFVIILPFTTTDEKGNTKRQYITIPKALELSVITQLFDSFTQLTTTGKMDIDVSKKALQTSIPSINLLDVPVLDATWSYIANYDRFKGQQIWKGEEVLPEDEYTKNTNEFFKSMGDILKMSPERLQTATGKVLTDTKYNIYSIIVGKQYNAIRESLSDDAERKELDKTFFEHIGEIFKPFANKYIRETNPYYQLYKDKGTRKSFIKRLMEDRTEPTVPKTETEKEEAKLRKKTKEEDVKKAAKEFGIKYIPPKSEQKKSSNTGLESEELTGDELKRDELTGDELK